MVFPSLGPTQISFNCLKSQDLAKEKKSVEASWNCFQTLWTQSTSDLSSHSRSPRAGGLLQWWISGIDQERYLRAQALKTKLWNKKQPLWLQFNYQDQSIYWQQLIDELKIATCTPSTEKCACRELNPGHKHGRLVWYRYTTCAIVLWAQIWYLAASG